MVKKSHIIVQEKLDEEIAPPVYPRSNNLFRIHEGPLIERDEDAHNARYAKLMEAKAAVGLIEHVKGDRFGARLPENKSNQLYQDALVNLSKAKKEFTKGITTMPPLRIRKKELKTHCGTTADGGLFLIYKNAQNYLASVGDTITAYILRSAVEEVKKKKHSRINPVHITNAVLGDSELMRLFGQNFRVNVDGVANSSGVMPHLHGKRSKHYMSPSYASSVSVPSTFNVRKGKEKQLLPEYYENTSSGSKRKLKNETTGHVSKKHRAESSPPEEQDKKKDRKRKKGRKDPAPKKPKSNTKADQKDKRAHKSSKKRKPSKNDSSVHTKTDVESDTSSEGEQEQKRSARSSRLHDNLLQDISDEETSSESEEKINTTPATQKTLDGSQDSIVIQKNIAGNESEIESSGDSNVLTQDVLHPPPAHSPLQMPYPRTPVVILNSTKKIKSTGKAHSVALQDKKTDAK